VRGAAAAAPQVAASLGSAVPGGGVNGGCRGAIACSKNMFQTLINSKRAAVFSPERGRNAARAARVFPGMSTTTHAPDLARRADRGDFLVNVTNGGPRITGGWSGERQVLIPSFLVAAVAVGAMSFLEKMF